MPSTMPQGLVTPTPRSSLLLQSQRCRTGPGRAAQRDVGAAPAVMGHRWGRTGAGTALQPLPPAAFLGLTSGFWPVNASWGGHAAER